MANIKTYLAGLVSLISALLYNGVFGAILFGAVGLDPMHGAVTGGGFSLALGSLAPAGALRSGVHKEVWTGEVVKALRTALASLGWLDRIRDYSQYADNDIIHFTELGGDPRVLVNNSTYPIGVTALEDADKPVELDKFDTENTPVTDDELHAISYDKMATVIERHKEAITEARAAKAIHSLAPDVHSVTNPIILTTGAVVDGRRVLTPADLASLKKACDKAKMPKTGRVLVLCSEHVNDLLVADQRFMAQYNINQTDGTVARL